MTLREMTSLTGISENELAGYYSEGLIGKEKDGCVCFSAQDAKDVGLIRTLKNFGLKTDEVLQFFSYIRQDQVEKATQFLRTLRARLLKEIHDGQNSFDTLDCIIRVTEHKV